MIHRIIFDLDDTLIKTGEVFRKQLRKFTRYVCSEFEFVHDKRKVLEIQQARNRVLRNASDFSHSSFPNSLAWTWKFFCELADRKPRSKHLETVRGIGWETYEIIPDPLEGLERVLHDLANEYELVLYTMGSPEVQRPKIDHYDLRNWFSFIHIPLRKSVETLGPIYRPYEPRHALIIGDSLRTEIRPGLEHGLSVIHRIPEETWDFNRVKLAEEVPSVSRLPEITDHLP